MLGCEQFLGSYMQKWNILNLIIDICSVCVCVCGYCGCVVLVGNNGPHAFSIHSRPVGHRLRQEKSYDGAFLPLRPILSSFSYLSCKSFSIFGTIFSQNFHQSFSVSCFFKFTGSLALTRKNWGTRGDI